MVLSPFIRSGQKHLARHRERGRRQEEEVGRQHQGIIIIIIIINLVTARVVGMDRPGVCQVPEGCGEQGKMDETGCEVFCGAVMTLAVKG